jgi:hypothetical protein
MAQHVTVSATLETVQGWQTVAVGSGPDFWEATSAAYAATLALVFGAKCGPFLLLHASRQRER